MPALRHRAQHFILKKLGFFNRAYRETHFGRRFVIPIINGRKTYVTEAWMTEVLRTLLRLREGGFIDVGVNLGQTMLKVAAIDPTREYVGFEPNATCVDYVWKLIEANGLPYRIVPAGLSNETTILDLQLFRNDDTDSSASLVAGFRPGAVGSRAVVTLGLSELPEGTMPENASIVKIDVEGGELEVIEGLLPYLREVQPFVVMEILPARNPGRLERQQKIENHFRDLGYAMFRIRRDHHENLAGVTRITECGVVEDLAMCDYLMVPERDHDRIVKAFG